MDDALRIGPVEDEDASVGVFDEDASLVALV